MNRAFLTVLALASGFALAACGEDAAVDPAVWAGTFCGGLNQVISSSQVTPRTADPEGQQEALLRMAESVQESLDTAADQLGELGPPAIPEGARTQEVVLEFFSSAAQATGDQRDRLADLEPSAPDFKQRLAALAEPGSMLELAERVREVTSEPDLAPAFRDASQCQAMGGAGR